MDTRSVIAAPVDPNTRIWRWIVRKTARVLKKIACSLVRPGPCEYNPRMAKTAKKAGSGGSTIALNKKAGHDYFIEERYEAGIALEGWEVKSLRAGRINIKESYVIIKDNEAWLLGCLITPLPTASTHIQPDPTRTRKLLMHRGELNKLIGAVERKGYTLVPTAMYWKRGRAKLEVGLAKGKKQHDKRASEKDRDWQREKERLFKSH